MMAISGGGRGPGSLALAAGVVLPLLLGGCVTTVKDTRPVGATVGQQVRSTPVGRTNVTARPAAGSGAVRGQIVGPGETATVAAEQVRAETPQTREAPDGAAAAQRRMEETGQELDRMLRETPAM